MEGGLYLRQLQSMGCSTHARCLTIAIDGADVHSCFDLAMNELIGIDRIGCVDESAVGFFFYFQIQHLLSSHPLLPR